MRLPPARRVLPVVAALVLLLIAVGIAVAVRTFAVYTDARDARASLSEAVTVVQRGGFNLTAADADRASDLFAEADRSLARVEAALNHDPTFAIVSLIPSANTQVDAATDLIHAARLLTSRHEALRGLLGDFVAARDAGEGAERLAALVRFLGETREPAGDLVAAIAEANLLVSGVPSEGLAGPLADTRTLLATQLEHARPLAEGWRTAQAVVPRALGVDGEQRYLMVALDNAELRPVGGFTGAFGTPTFRDGLLTDHAFRAVEDVEIRADVDRGAPAPAALRDHLFGSSPWGFDDAGWWPDFATSAAEMRRLYAIDTGDANFQGAIAFTPQLVDELLTIVGPVQIPDAGITVHPGQTYLVSLEQVEILNQGEGRKQFLADLASEVLTRLFALPPERYPDVLAALARSAERRQLQVVLDDPELQSAVTELGWYTPFRFPPDGDRLAVIDGHVAPLGKLYAITDVAHSLEVTLRPDGTAADRLVTTYTNRHAGDLPPELERLRPAFGNGVMGTYQRRFLVPDATVLSISGDGDPPVNAAERIEEEAGSLTVGNYLLVRPGQTTLETTYLAPGVVTETDDPARSGTYRLSFWKQAGRDSDTLTVRVTVPEGTVPVEWSEGGELDGTSVVFTTTTELDRLFEVTYAPAD